MAASGDGALALRVRPDVAAALAAGEPVVALESTLIAHGLPRPGNLDVAHEVEAIVAAEGAVPATVGVVGGVATVGLDADELAVIAGVRSADGADGGGKGVAKLGVRDLAVAAALGADGATTVASTAVLAARAGITVFATGGLGGVHRQARESWDESSDLTTLAATPVVVVCAGVKSILDVGATLERLESLGVGVVGYRTLRFPGFYVTDSGHALDWSVDSPEQVAAILAAKAALGVDHAALIVANPLPVDEQLDPRVHDRALAAGLARLKGGGMGTAIRGGVAPGDAVTGKAVTPFLLDFLHSATRGQSLTANIAVIRRNARLAAQIAVAWSAVA